MALAPRSMSCRCVYNHQTWTFVPSTLYFSPYSSFSTKCCLSCRRRSLCSPQPRLSRPKCPLRKWSPTLSNAASEMPAIWCPSRTFFRPSRCELPSISPGKRHRSRFRKIADSGCLRGMPYPIYIFLGYLQARQDIGQESPTV